MLTFPLVCGWEGQLLVSRGRVHAHHDQGHHQLGDHVASVSAGARVGTPHHPPPAYIYTTITSTEQLRPHCILRSDI